MAKLDIKLTVYVQAEGANILAQTEGVMRESLSSIMDEIVPDEDGISYQATLEKEPVKIQPTKRGRWIISNLYAQCSECSVAYDLDTFQRLIPMNENVPRHCTYCGARMDLKDGDAE